MYYCHRPEGSDNDSREFLISDVAVTASAGRGAPERSDQFQPPGHRPPGTAELRRDLVDGVPLQFPDCDSPQVRVAQDFEETTIRVGELRGELGGGLRAGDVVEPGRLVVGSV